MSLAALALMWLSAAPASASSAQEPALEFRVAGKARQRLTLGELKAKLTSENVRFFSPFNDHEKNYEAFPVRDVLNLAYGQDWRKADYSDIAFIALDGYEGVGGLSKLSYDAREGIGQLIGSIEASPRARISRRASGGPCYRRPRPS